MLSNAETQSPRATETNRLLIGGAGLAALLSASCCVLPIGLSIIGLGGSWLTMLGPFIVYRVELLIVVGFVLAWGWYRFWRRWSCAKRRGSTLLVLAFATVSFALSASSPLWEAEAVRTMFALWRDSLS